MRRICASRTQPSDNNFFPLLPFNGTIQDVAIYKAVLSNTTIRLITRRTVMAMMPADAGGIEGTIRCPPGEIVTGLRRGDP